MKWLAALLVLLPGSALALSCLPWGVPDAFAAMQRSPELYVIVHGDIRFDPALLPMTDWDNQSATPAHTEILADLAGTALTQDGFSAPFRDAISLQINCAGPWCPRVEQGPVLVFLKRDGDMYTVAQGPCGGMLFGRPAQADLSWIAERIKVVP